MAPASVPGGSWSVAASAISGGTRLTGRPYHGRGAREYRRTHGREAHDGGPARRVPGRGDALQAFFAALVAEPALDEKTKQLVYVAAAAAAGHVRGVPARVARLRALGATRQEVFEALLMTLPAAGFGPLSQCLPAAMAVFDG